MENKHNNVECKQRWCLPTLRYDLFCFQGCCRTSSLGMLDNLFQSLGSDGSFSFLWKLSIFALEFSWNHSSPHWKSVLQVYSCLSLNSHIQVLSALLIQILLGLGVEILLELIPSFLIRFGLGDGHLNRRTPEKVYLNTEHSTNCIKLPTKILYKRRL